MESYSYKTKKELCRQAPTGKCCAVAECYGMLLFGNTFSMREIRIVTGNAELGKRIFTLFLLAFKTSFDVMPDEDEKGKQMYAITETSKLDKIFDLFGFTRKKMLAHHVNLGMLEDECCRTGFVRGAFLTGGAVTDPKKSYHLELVTAHYNVSRQTYSLLLEMDFSPKETSRSGNYIVYFKQSEAIADFLTLLGAPTHATQLMLEKIEKDMRNAVNRKVNCDTANVTKMIDAAETQISAIEKIKSEGAFETLPEKLKQAAQLRLENPQSAIKELGELATPPVSKSCMNHRIRKLTEISLTFNGS